MMMVMKTEMARDGAQLRLRPCLVAAGAVRNVGGIGTVTTTTTMVLKSERCPTERDLSVDIDPAEAGHRVWGGQTYYL